MQVGKWKYILCNFFMNVLDPPYYPVFFFFYIGIMEKNPMSAASISRYLDNESLS